MFERYTEKARRVIFFARYEASQYGSSTIESEHLLLGVMREDRVPVPQIEAVRREIESHITIRERIPTSVEMQLSEECKHILNYATDEAERLGHKHVDTGHLLLGIQRETERLAARILKDREVTTRAKEWCCSEFQARCYQPGRREHGLGILFLMSSKTGTHFLFEYRRAVRQPMEPIAADGIKLRFCPWCGRNLAQWYGFGLPPFDPPAQD
jgi:ATP-dependent Clp protease ATP-binding subunit ClpA